MRRAVFMLVIALIYAAIIDPIQQAYAENQGSEAESLIGQLAGNRPKRNQKLSTLPPDQIAKASDSLTALKTAAFPALIAHRNDRHYSYTVGGEGIANEAPGRIVKHDHTVGDVCVSIIARQFYTDHAYQGSVHFIPDVVAVDDLPSWWKAHSSMSIAELRKEALKQTIAKEKERSKKIKGTWSRLAADRATQLEADLAAMESK
jgi:hypothetical protein